MAKISELFSRDATDNWFTMSSRSGSAHENLRASGFSIVDRPELEGRYGELEVPVDRAELSWGDSVPKPRATRLNAFLTKYPSDLRDERFRDRLLADMLSDWMARMPGEQRFLVSLNPDSYLFAAGGQPGFEEVFTVSRSWSIDCFIAVFDETQTMLFVFDVEFGVVYCSFEESAMPEGYLAIREEWNAAFRETFVRDAKFRTGADPVRVEEYYRTVLEPAL